MDPHPPAPPIRLGFVAFAAAVTAIGGFLFGYDTAVINGANTFLQAHFRLDPETDAWWIGLATSSAVLGCIPGAMAAGFLSDRFGRRKLLFFCAALFAVSGVLSAIPQTYTQFILARLLSGIAIGVSSMVCPVYIAEIAPPSWRGRLGTLFQLGIVSGIFLTLFVNGWIQGLGDGAWNTASGWRWMLGAEVLPALFFLGLLFPIPESPRWLLAVGRETEARAVLERIGGAAHAGAEVAAVQAVLREEQGSFLELFGSRYRIPLFLAFALMVGSQFSGINAIMYYSTSIFLKASESGRTAAQVAAFRGGLADAGAAESGATAAKALEAARAALLSVELKPVLERSGAPAGLVGRITALAGSGDLAAMRAGAAGIAAEVSAHEPMSLAFDELESVANRKAFTSTVWIGLVNLLATWIAILLVDKAGRKPLLLLGNAVQVAALAVVGWLYHLGPRSTGLLLVAVIVYIAAFAMAMGPLGWVVCSEIFPARLRGRAMSVATFFIWTACYLVATGFPVLLGAVGPAATFWVFAACSLATFLAVLFLLPETKGRTLEEIERSWARPA